MAPSFGFFRNLTNHQPKSSNNADYPQDRPTKLVKRKSKTKKTAHLQPTPQHHLVDSFNDIIGAANQLEDILPSRYPPHPFSVGSRAGSNLGSNAYAEPLSHRPAPVNLRHEGFQRAGTSIPRSNPPIMLNHSQYDAHQRPSRNRESPNSQPSISHVHEHRLDVDNSFSTQVEEPEVSQYMHDGYRYPQIPQEVPLPPSPPQSWGHIPSVHREPSRTEESYNSPDREGVGEQSWLQNGNLDKRFSSGVTDPRVSHMSEIQRPDSRSVHTFHYIEHADNPIPPPILRSQPEALDIPPNIHHNENAARRQPQAHFQAPPHVVEEIILEPKMSPVARRQPPSEGYLQRPPHPAERIILEPETADHEYWGDEDSDPEVYHYIVPAGLKVTFQDQDGNVITKVGKTGRVESASRSFKSAPIVVHDEFGRELYRSKNVRGPSPTPRELQQGHLREHGRSLHESQNIGFPDNEVFELRTDGRNRHPPPWISHPSTISSKSMKTIMVDEIGNQIPIKSPSVRRDGGRRLEQPIHDISYSARISNI